MKSGDHFVIYEDITEHKNLEDRLLQAQKMESLGTLAGGIAHDFNNILMGIQGRTSLMLMNLDASHPHLNHLKGIEEHIRSAAGLTRQLLGFAKGGKFQIKPTHLNHVMGKSIEMFGRTRKDISINTDFQEDLWSVETDPGQIEQVLLNLYVNAWQAMPAGGEIFVGTRNVNLDQTQAEPKGLKPGKYVRVSVKDTGVGMDEETQRRIFEPFFTTKDMGRGTGLGLASAYGIIKNHGGLIEVRSRKGQGTTFEIYLPVTRKKVREERSEEQDIQKGTETVLLIDDEAMILEVAESMLKELGYQVIPVRGGVEGLGIYRLKQQEIHMVILDMIMPGMRGAEVYRRLKVMNSNVRVLLASGYSMDEQAKDILEEGCDGFIQKPFRMKDLSKKVREILDKK
jgi:nitrogen-specific signal transduction histidine kinase/CheY-like chemotaxis protein